MKAIFYYAILLGLQGTLTLNAQTDSLPVAQNTKSAAATVEKKCSPCIPGKISAECFSYCAKLEVVNAPEKQLEKELVLYKSVAKDSVLNPGAAAKKIKSFANEKETEKSILLNKTEEKAYDYLIKQRQAAF